MSEITLDIGQVRVYRTTDVKGNDLVAVEILGHEVLYASPFDMLRDDQWKGYIEEAPGLGLSIDTESLQDLFSSALARRLAGLLLESPLFYGPSVWQETSPTGRETWGTRHPRVREGSDD
jgi:hypothetical protein